MATSIGMFGSHFRTHYGGPGEGYRKYKLQREWREQEGGYPAGNRELSSYSSKYSH